MLEQALKHEEEYVEQALIDKGYYTISKTRDKFMKKILPYHHISTMYDQNKALEYVKPMIEQFNEKYLDNETRKLNINDAYEISKIQLKNEENKEYHQYAKKVHKYLSGKGIKDYTKIGEEIGEFYKLKNELRQEYRESGLEQKLAGMNSEEASEAIDQYLNPKAKKGLSKRSKIIGGILLGGLALNAALQTASAIQTMPIPRAAIQNHTGYAIEQIDLDGDGDIDLIKVYKKNGTMNHHYKKSGN